MNRRIARFRKKALRISDRFTFPAVSRRFSTVRRHKSLRSLRRYPPSILLFLPENFTFFSSVFQTFFFFLSSLFFITSFALPFSSYCLKVDGFFGSLDIVTLHNDFKHTETLRQSNWKKKRTIFSFFHFILVSLSKYSHRDFFLFFFFLFYFILFLFFVTIIIFTGTATIALLFFF